MKVHILSRSQLIAAPLEDVFTFFEDPRNLSRVTPPWLRFEIAHVDGLPLRAGSRIEYRIRWLGHQRVWRATIEEFDRPRRFVDVQLQGPYRRWRHEHSFEAVGEGTLMRDRVEYQLPYGVLGRIAHWAVVDRQLRQIFDYRAAIVGEILGGSESTGSDV